MDINAPSNRAAPPGVSAAIHGAATATGTSFEYLLATAQVESGLNPQASSTTSTARGLYQIIDQTWLATMKQAGPSLGYAKYADAIVQTAPGHYEVRDPAARRDIMALRDDPAANAAMAGALTQTNAAQLAGRLGRKASDGELYIAHFLGPAGAAKLADLANTAPAAAADAAFPAAAEANRAIFYDRQGHARSAAEVYGVLVGRYDGARNPASPGASAASAAATATLMLNAARASPSAGVGAGVAAAAPSAVPQAAAQSGPLFQGMFSDRSGAVSPFVQELWASRPQVAAALGAATPDRGAPARAAVPSSAAPPDGSSTTTAAVSTAAPAAAPGSPRELFQTQATNVSGLFGR